jgi:endonuclease-3
MLNLILRARLAMETKAHGEAPAPKRAFDVDEALRRIREAVQPFPRAAMFELAEDGFRSVLQQVVACIISIRTYDEVSLVLARRLFARAPEAAALAALPVEEIDALIGQCSFHEAKAREIQAIATLALERYGGELPCDEAVLLSLPGVGHKCANLALGIACGQPFISVDVHVHRVTNRWGYVSTRSPVETMRALDRDQRAARPLRQAYLHGPPAALLHVPRSRHVPPGRRWRAPLSLDTTPPRRSPQNPS